LTQPHKTNRYRDGGLLCCILSNGWVITRD
jgi:hypothetical protein